MNYYNDFDKFACAWLRELIAAKLIPQGDVDERSITDVAPDDLRGYTQCHFFAGIGGWSHALQLAGWPESRPIWTGSCPCQPFSDAGKHKGLSDERDLWPTFFNLIRAVKPVTVMGEQVAGAIKHGWLDRVCDDFEAENYTVWAAVLGAFSVGAPQKRSRLYWMGKSISARGHRRDKPRLAESRDEMGEPKDGESSSNQPRHRCAAPDALANGNSGRCQQFHTELRGIPELDQSRHTPFALANGSRPRLEKRKCVREIQPETVEPFAGETPKCGSDAIERFWSSAVPIQLRDGTYRRIPPESALFPLASRLPGRMGLLRGAGGSIVPQVAAAFIQAYMNT